MTVKQYLLDKISEGTVHVALLDPDKQDAEVAGEMALRMKEAGTDAVFIGGSTGLTVENMTDTANAIREKSGLPVIYFPGTPEAITPAIDAILFMSLMNSRDLNLVVRAQAYSAPIIKKLGIEAISMGYIVVEPGMKVGKVGQADLIERDRIDKAIGYAMAAEMLGMSLVYLEAGSGADRPVPPEMISAVKAIINVPLIVGGGIRTPEAAEAARKAGADIIVTGTFIEQCDDTSKLKAVVSAAKGL
ncbi:MAG: geranylgeranylglyceryl/heptaprenylglyceryl phosphate synthase [Candidatus Methanomethylophilaceae archaeon]|nr:geranylgeranylglyceryl/heptaprenylglyceryl phosphate synthase [Candidatus Methanomethylophilaceae archaeon]MBQ8643622.1 geranylgeranylglyceryl/heptaprenylglyceryl phosphate synthase [Candidatus Methanomethylophilaceae archaeon]